MHSFHKQPLMMAQDNFGKFINQFQPENKILIRKLERILNKLYRQNLSLLFNQTCLKERLLPNNKYTYIYIYIYIYIYCHPQPDCFVVSQLFYVVRQAGCLDRNSSNFTPDLVSYRSDI